MLKKMLQAVGVGGPTVDAVLPEEPVQPGGQLSGEIHVGGATTETSIQRIQVGLIAEVETGDGQHGGVLYQRVQVCDDFDLAAEQHHTLPFTLTLPWQSPITTVGGQPLPGMRFGLLTEAAVAKAVDTSDLDPVAVAPLPSQQSVLDALVSLGARLRHADLEHGHIRGAHQDLPFYQEIEFLPPAQFSGAVGEIEVTFLATTDDVEVVLEADRRGGLLGSGGDALGRFRRSHQDALATDWQAEITQWLQSVAASGHRSGAHGGHKHGHSRLGAGAGGFAAGALGGMMIGEMFGEGGMDIGDMGF